MSDNTIYESVHDGWENVKAELVKQPFNKISYLESPDGTIAVKAFLTEELEFEATKIGLAIDGSISMKQYFGAGDKDVDPLKRKLEYNQVSDFLVKYAHQLAERDYDKELAVIYWATGRRGKFTEPGGKDGNGVLSVKEAREAKYFTGPKNWGTNTYLLPVLEYFFEDEHKNSGDDLLSDLKYFFKEEDKDSDLDDEIERLFYLIITDGVIKDLPKVVEFCRELSQKIVDNNHKLYVKFFLAGIGDEISDDQIEEIDNMNQQHNFEEDLWDAARVENIPKLDVLFREWVETVQKTILTYIRGKILAADKTPVEKFDTPNGRLPLLCAFRLPKSSKCFFLELDGEEPIEQRLF